MKKKKVFSKSLAIVLVLSLMLSVPKNLSVFAQETSIKEKSTEKSELWQPESNTNALSFEGDLSIEELQSAKLSAEDTPEIVSKDSIEENGHVNRLWKQEEDMNSIVFQNRDGTKTMYYYNYPVKYKDANGKIKDKSNKISKTSSGDYTNAGNDINTYFPKKLNSNNGIELKFGEYVVEMAPDIKGNSGASRQTGHNKYFEPTEYVQYPNVFDESISLRYTPTFEGYKEDIVLSKYVGINEFSFHLYTDGLSLVMDEDGTYCLADPLSGEVKTQIGDLVVYDSKPFEAPDKILNESVSNPTEEDYAKKEAILKEAKKNAAKESSSVAKTYSHQYKVKKVKQDNEYLITIVVDEDYLTDKERVYPVYVDPTINVSGSGTGKTIQDAPIYSARPNNTHSNNEINVVGYTGYWNGANHGVGRTLMKFPGLSGNSTYAYLQTNQITSLQLHIYEGSGSTNTVCIDLWQYTGASWTESTARCGNIGWDSYSNNFTWNYINSSGWQTFDLTSMVSTWKGSSSALDKGIMLKNYSSESNSGYSKHFMSTESSYQPYLTFSWNGTQAEGIVSGGVYRIQSGYGKYLSAISSTNITQQSFDSNSGAQMWYLEYLNNGYYKISTVGLREPTTLGEKEYVLSSNGTNICLKKDTNAFSQQWALQKNGSAYFICNRSNMGIVLTVDNDVGSPYLDNKFSYSTWIFSKVVTDAYDNIGLTFQGGTINPIRINYIIEDSAITNWMPYSMYQDAGNRWNDIDSNVTTGVYRAGATNIPDGFNVYVTGNKNLEGYGKTTTSYNTTHITRVKIEINTKDGVMNATRLTDIDRRMNIIHEMGHAWRILDINIIKPGLNVVAIMRQGLPTDNITAPALPNGYDKSTLSSRW